MKYNIYHLHAYSDHKIILQRHVGDKEERRYSSYSFLTSVLDGFSGQRRAPAALYAGKEPPVSIVQEAG
jgi:hypothetical protein